MWVPSELNPPCQNSTAPAHLRSKSAALRIGIVDGNPSTRDAVRWLLETSPGIESVAVFPTFGLAMASLMGPAIPLLVSESSIGGSSVLEWLPRFKAASPGTAILIHTEAGDPRTVTGSLARGASGYLLKSDPPGFLLEAVRAVLGGGIPISPYLIRSLLDRASPRTEPEEPPGRRPLSPREKQLVDGLSRGLRYRELATELGISVETVRTHLKRIYAKMKVGCRGEALAKYVRSEEPRSKARPDTIPRPPSGRL